MSDGLEVELALLRSHCARKDQPQAHCMGQVTITAAGIELSCKLCGNGGVDAYRFQGAHDRARAIVEAAGVSWGALSVESRQRAAEEACRDTCPGCGTRVALLHSYMRCICGEWAWSTGGWRREDRS